MDDNFKVQVDKIFGSPAAASSSSSTSASTPTTTTPSLSLWSLTDDEIERKDWVRDKTISELDSHSLLTSGDSRVFLFHFEKISGHFSMFWDISVTSRGIPPQHPLTTFYFFPLHRDTRTNNTLYRLSHTYMFPSMASLIQFLLLILYLTHKSQALSFHLPNALVLPITKDVTTLQYVTRIHHGTPLVPINLVVDLGGPFVWTDCASTHVSSSSRLIPNRSIKCSRAKAHDFESKSGLSSTQTCELFPENRVTRMSTRGDLVEDIVAVQSKAAAQSPPSTTSSSLVDQHFYYMVLLTKEIKINVQK